MSYTLRPYQQEAVDKTIEWVRLTTDPALVEMSVGAGKSIYIAEVARIIHDMSGGKRVLCLAPRAELVKQNAEKYTSIAGPASLYSASAGQKSLRHPVIFATPQTFKKVAKRLGHEFAAVIIDECEGTTPSIIGIIDDMKEGNPNLRVIGTTGTPFTTLGGYIFKIDDEGNSMPESQSRDPYYTKNLYRVTTRQLLDAGYLTPAVVGDIGVSSYDAISLQPNAGGKFSSADIDKVFVGHGRKTSMIVADAMERMAERKSIVFFASTLNHAGEIMASFHPDAAAVVSGKTKNRTEILARFAAGKLRVLINVNVLTVGWDCPRVDGIALLRATESARLLAQIIGRGLRLFEGKEDCLLLDYAQNFERHAKDGDIFNPSIKASYKGTEGGEIVCECPECGGVNMFSARPNRDGFEINASGYFIDLDGNEIVAEGTDKSLPAHFGRRCQVHYMNKLTRSYDRCGYYWSYKECPDCEHFNDIAARACRQCKAELINPAEKLVLSFKRAKRDPGKPQCDEILSMDIVDAISRSGNPIARVTFYTASRLFVVYYQTESSSQWAHDKYAFFMASTKQRSETPRTVSYIKKGDFWEVTDFNQPTDKETLDNEISRLA